MFSFACVKTVFLASKSLVQAVYSSLVSVFVSNGLLSFTRFVRGFYYTFTSSFWEGFYSVRLVVLPIFHKPNNKYEINLNTIFITNPISEAL